MEWPASVIWRGSMCKDVRQNILLVLYIHLQFFLTVKLANSHMPI